MDTFATKINEASAEAQAYYAKDTYHDIIDDKIKKVTYPGGSYYIHIAPNAVKFLRICRKARAQGFNAIENCWGDICSILPKHIMYTWANTEADRLGLYDLRHPETIENIGLHGVDIELPKREAAQTRTRTRRVRGEYCPKQR